MRIFAFIVAACTLAAGLPNAVLAADSCRRLDGHPDPKQLEQAIDFISAAARFAIEHRVSTEADGFRSILIGERELRPAMRGNPLPLISLLRDRFNGYGAYPARRAVNFRATLGVAFPYFVSVFNLDDCEFGDFTKFAEAQWLG